MSEALVATRTTRTKGSDRPPLAKGAYAASMTEPIPPSRVRRAYAVGCLFSLGTLALVVGSFVLWATRPIASDQQVADAAAQVERARQEPLTMCPRPVLRGEALPGDGAEGIAALAGMESRFLSCLVLVGGNLTTAREVLLADDSVRLASAEVHPFEERAALACAGLDTHVQSLLQRASGCTAQPLFRAEEDVSQMQQLEWALFLLARARIHEGRLQEGVELLLDVIRLGQDLSRGRASLVPVGTGSELQLSAAWQVEAIVASDLPWTSAMLEALERQAHVLATTMPEPTSWFPNDDLWVRQRALHQLDAWGDTALRDLAVADYAETQWPDCTGLATQACESRYRSLGEHVFETVETLDRLSWIPGVHRETDVRGGFYMRLRERESALGNAAYSAAAIEALQVLFLHRRMALSGTCPTAAALQTEALTRGYAGYIETTTGAPDPIRIGRSTDTTILRAYCPALHEGDTPNGGMP